MNIIEKQLRLQDKLGAKCTKLSIKGLMFSKHLSFEDALEYLYQQTLAQTEQLLQKVG